MALRNLFLVLLVSTFSFAACGEDNKADDGQFDSDARVGATDADVPETCNFTNCEGCCDGTTCVNPTSNSACGQPGSICETCTNGDTCAAGSCVVPTANCDGCTGCCLDNTQCLAGTTIAACGSDGDSCSACPEGQGCIEGECVTTVCDASNCAEGCCTANGACITTEQSKAACGDNAMACEVCADDAISCTLGTCVEDQPCLDFCTDGCCNSSGQCIEFEDQAAGVCGAAETCSPCTGEDSCINGECTANPVWRVIVDNAVVTNTNQNGEEWDNFFGSSLPDPYVGGRLIGNLLFDWTTTTIDNTLTPNWDQTKDSYLESELIGTGLRIDVRDSDGLGVYETMATCNVMITANDLAAGTLTTTACAPNVVSLELDFVKQ